MSGATITRKPAPFRIPNAKVEPIEYLRLIGRDFNAVGDRTKANEILDVIIAIRDHHNDVIAALREILVAPPADAKVIARKTIARAEGRLDL